MREISVISLESGDLLIIGFRQGTFFDGLPAEIFKLKNGKIARLRKLNKVFVKRVIISKNVKLRYFEPLSSLRFGSTIYFWNREAKRLGSPNFSTPAFMHRIFLDDNENLLLEKETIVRTPNFDSALQLFPFYSVQDYCVLE